MKRYKYYKMCQVVFESEKEKEEFNNLMDNLAYKTKLNKSEFTKIAVREYGERELKK